MIHFNHPNFSDKVACIVENDLILESLYRQLGNLPHVEVKNLSRLESCKLPKDGVDKSEVTLKTGEQFSCDLLVSYFLLTSCFNIIILFANSSIFLDNKSIFVSTSFTWFLMLKIVTSLVGRLILDGAAIADGGSS